MLSQRQAAGWIWPIRGSMQTTVPWNRGREGDVCGVVTVGREGIGDKSSPASGDMLIDNV